MHGEPSVENIKAKNSPVRRNGFRPNGGFLTYYGEFRKTVRARRENQKVTLPKPTLWPLA